MRVLHDEAMNDADYKNNFYPVQIRKMNKGGLFLVKKEFFPFFSDVLKDVYNFFQKHTLSNMNDDIARRMLNGGCITRAAVRFHTCMIHHAKI